MAQHWEYTPNSSNNPIDKGYYVTNPKPKGRANTRLSAYSVPDTFLDLWITDVEADFQISGNTAQSRTRRTFFPRNFVQPAFKITGMAQNNFKFNEMAEFFREQQMRYVNRQGLNTGGDESGSPVTRLRVYGSGVNVVGGKAGSMKGRHKQIAADGYVKSIRRGAKRFEFATEYTFEFIVTFMYSGPYEDKRVVARQLNNWVDVLKHLKEDQAKFKEIGPEGDELPDPTPSRNTSGGSGGRDSVQPNNDGGAGGTGDGVRPT